MGSLDLVSSLISELFLVVYFSLNLACFALRVSGAPNFRPHFKQFSWKTALAGALLSLAVMFISRYVYHFCTTFVPLPSTLEQHSCLILFGSPSQALIAIFLVAFMTVVVYIYAPPKPWGDVSQAIIFHQVRKYLLRLDIRRQHPKFWRPSILLCVDTPHTASMLIDFCNSLKKGGLYLIGNVIVAPYSVRMAQLAEELQMLWVDYISITNIKAFSEICLAESLRAGFYSMFMLSGIGGMKPNTVVFQFFPDAEEDQYSTGEEDRLGSSSGSSLTQEDRDLLVGVADTTEAIKLIRSSSSSSTSKSQRNRVSTNSRPSQLWGSGRNPNAIRKRNMRMIDEELVADKMDSVRSKMEYLMQRVVQKKNGNTDADATIRKDMTTKETKLEHPPLATTTTTTTTTTGGLRRQNSLLVSSEVQKDNVGELVAIMGDALALKKNIVLARHFDQLNADTLRNWHEEHLGVNMTVDVWVIANDAMNPDWDSMEGDLSLQVQLAYCLLASRNSSWNKYTTLRVVLVAVVREEDVLTTVSIAMEDCKHRLTHLLNEIRIEADIHVEVGRVKSQNSSGNRSNSGSNGPPPMLDTTTLNSLIYNGTKEGVAMLFLQLPDCPVEGSTNDEIMLYVRNLKALTSKLPPLALVKSARQRTMTTEL